MNMQKIGYWAGLLLLLGVGWITVLNDSLERNDTTTGHQALMPEKDVSAYFMSENPLSPLDGLTAMPLTTFALLKPRQDRYLQCAIGEPNTDASDFETAYKLGAYAAYWAYSAHYAQAEAQASYLAAAEQCAQNLDIVRYANTSSSHLAAALRKPLDCKKLMTASLDQLESVAFNLKENKREYLCADILAGVWVEMAYLQIGTYISRPNEAMRSHIMEQQHVLDDLIFALEPYREQQHHGELLQTLEALLKLYRAIPPVPPNWNAAESSQGSLHLQNDRQIKLIFDKIMEYRLKWRV